jgi:hypothetical protein
MEEDNHDEILEEWDLEANPVPLPLLCELCSGDATDGQSIVDGIICSSCLDRLTKGR